MNPRALRAAAIAVVVVGLGVLAYNVVSSDSAGQEVLTQLEEVAPPSSPAPTVPSPDAEDDFPAVTTSAIRAEDDRDTPITYEFSILETISHDREAYTQGFELSNGRLFESTGLVGESSIREVDPSSGEVLRQTDVAEVFAEGLTIVDGSAIQLTWKAGLAFRYDTETFALTDTYEYDGEGWGLCYDDTELVMSNGTSTLDFRDPASFAVLRSVDVTLSGAPVEKLNELECVEGLVWANIWQSSLIVQIDPGTGNVLGVLNAATLTPPEFVGNNSSVLNGIAYDPADGTYLLTGKNWPSMYRVQITPAAQ